MKRTDYYDVKRKAKSGISTTTKVVLVVAIVGTIILALGVAEYGMHGRGLGPASTTNTSVTSGLSVSVHGVLYTLTGAGIESHTGVFAFPMSHIMYGINALLAFV